MVSVYISPTLHPNNCPAHPQPTPPHPWGGQYPAKKRRGRGGGGRGERVRWSGVVWWVREVGVVWCWPQEGWGVCGLWGLVLWWGGWVWFVVLARWLWDAVSYTHLTLPTICSV
eukprot:8295252-Prorocentrum_lima.AAC.1